jgi:hypothetical protein
VARGRVRTWIEKAAVKQAYLGLQRFGDADATLGLGAGGE